jgi:hypothetical protein
MRLSRLWQDSDFAILAALALIAVLLHTLTNGQYGFHRDATSEAPGCGAAWRSRSRSDGPACRADSGVRGMMLDLCPVHRTLKNTSKPRRPSGTW